MQPKAWQAFFWPPVIDPKYRKSAIWMGCFASFFYAVMWGLMAIGGPIIYFFETQNVETLHKSFQAIIHFIIASSIGWGIYKKNKIATVAGLFLSIVGFINSLVIGDYNGGLMAWLCIIFMFVQSTRGIFAHHYVSKSLETETMEK